MITGLLTSVWVAAIAIIIGFVLLVYGADWLVDGASAVAQRLGVSELVIGLTVVAFGTSMPEFIVSTLAAIEHNSEIAITNILGSNAINTFIILGCTALICPVASQLSCRRFDIPLNLVAGVVVFVYTYFFGQLDVWAGLILLCFFVWFMVHSLRTAKQPSVAAATAETPSHQPMRPVTSYLLILAGLVFLVLGGEAVVRGATSIAQRLGVSDAIIGLTIVALGTSLPELFTSCVAAYKHNCDLALGNIVGSNIFNVFFILGVGALIHPMPAYTGLILDAGMVVLSIIMVMLFVYTTQKHEIKRWHGAMLLLTYAIYLSYRIYTL